MPLSLLLVAVVGDAVVMVVVVVATIILIVTSPLEIGRGNPGVFSLLPLPLPFKPLPLLKGRGFQG